MKKDIKKTPIGRHQIKGINKNNLLRLYLENEKFARRYIWILGKQKNFSVMN